MQPSVATDPLQPVVSQCVSSTSTTTVESEKDSGSSSKKEQSKAEMLKRYMNRNAKLLPYTREQYCVWVHKIFRVL